LQEQQFEGSQRAKSFETARGTRGELRVPMPITNFTDLKVWQPAMNLVIEVYQLTDTFPARERFVLSAQTRKSAISIPSNIAEGFCRKSLPAYINHLNIALGSEGELFTQLEIGKRLRFASAADVDRRLQHLSEVGKMLRGLSTSLENRLDPSAERQYPDPCSLIPGP
jgi:four helix bundle protein